MSEKRDMFSAIILHGFITRGENASEKIIRQSVDAATLLEKVIDESGLASAQSTPTLRSTGGTPQTVLDAVDTEKRAKEMSDAAAKYAAANPGSKPAIPLT